VDFAGFIKEETVSSIISESHDEEETVSSSDFLSNDEEEQFIQQRNQSNVSLELRRQA